VDSGDYVVVKNAKHIALSGKKSEQKEYSWHSGYPGGLKTIKYNDFIKDHPTGVTFYLILANKEGCLGYVAKE
jgi:large subunit ribosomal protein L13